MGFWVLVDLLAFLLNNLSFFALDFAAIVFTLVSLSSLVLVDCTALKISSRLISLADFASLAPLPPRRVSMRFALFSWARILRIITLCAPTDCARASPVIGLQYFFCFSFLPALNLESSSKNSKHIQI